MKSGSRPASSHFVEVELFRLVFLGACLLYIWFQSLFLQTSHTVLGERHVFGYSWVGIALGFGFNIIPIGAAWFLWHKRHDRFGAGIMLLAIPIFAVFVMPQLFMERVEITPTQLSHRREPPLTRYNADIAFAEVVSVVELQYETGLRGYELRLKNGKTVELPANTVLTAARDTVAAQLGRWNIPVTSQTVRREQSQHILPL